MGFATASGSPITGLTAHWNGDSRRDSNTDVEPWRQV
jgi:hypothetical protein